jgi:hypothetical protein
VSTALANVLRCTYGTVEFQLVTFDCEQAPVVGDWGRTGTACTVTGSGYVQGADAADFAAKAAAAFADLSASGRDFVVYGLGGQPLYTLAAAACVQGGPHPKPKQRLGSAPLRMEFDFTIQATTVLVLTGGGGGGAPALDSFKVGVQFLADGRRVITRGGQVNGVDTPAFFLGQVLPQFQAAFATGKWVIEGQYEVSSDASKSQLTYTAKATELADTLPSGGGITAVDGTYSTRQERDEQHRLTRTDTYDLLVTGDPWALVPVLRPQSTTFNALFVLRESIEVVSIPDRRLRASFTQLTGGDGSPLMNYGQTLSIAEGQQTTYEVIEYIGSDPLVIPKPTSVRRVEQSGSATCAGRFLQAPPPLFPRLLEPPQVTYTHVNDVEKQTTWRYVSYPAGLDGEPVADALDRFFTPGSIARPQLAADSKQFL